MAGIINDTLRLAAYEASGGFKDGSYLVQHERETAAQFTARKQLARYPNYVRKILGYYTGGLFKQSPNRKIDDPQLTAFAENADGAGAALDGLGLRGMRLAGLVGTCFWVVDRPKEGGNPYVVARLPGEMIHSKQDAAGNLIEVAFGESDLKGGTQYRWWTPNTWKVTTDVEGAEVVDQGDHPVGEVPVVSLHSQNPLRQTSLVAAPWADDVVALNLDIFNSLSELRALLRSQAFGILTIPVKDREEAESLQALQVGPNNALTYNPEGGGRPSYIGPPPEPVDFYLRHLDAQRTRIYELASLEFMGMTAASGIALNFFYEGANRVLVDWAIQLERTETRLMRIVSRYLGREFEGDIGYPRDFNVKDMGTGLKIAMDSISLGLGAAFEAEAKKGVARQVLGQSVPPETLATIDAEIEAGGDPYGERTNQEAGV